jgi:hypothetical protein
MAQHSAKQVLLSDRQVAERYDVVVRTLERWDLDPAMGFPPPVRINRRRYRELRWKRGNVRRRKRADAIHIRASQHNPRRRSETAASACAGRRRGRSPDCRQ